MSGPIAQCIQHPPAESGITGSSPDGAILVDEGAANSPLGPDCGAWRALQQNFRPSTEAMQNKLLCARAKFS